MPTQTAGVEPKLVVANERDVRGQLRREQGPHVCAHGLFRNLK
jgi:hypothetical protein